MQIAPDFREFIGLLNANKVKYLIVGGYAVAFHGYPRYTKDLDVWLMVSEENAVQVMKSLEQFGFGQAGLKKKDFLSAGEFIQLGYPPLRIDLLTSCDGVTFEECYNKRIEMKTDGLTIDLMDVDSLRKNKRASGRPQDLADLDNLTPKP